MEKLIGKQISYITSNGEKRYGVIYSEGFHDTLKMTFYMCVSPYGNLFRLLREEFTIVEDYITCNREREGYENGLRDILLILHNSAVDNEEPDYEAIHKIATDVLFKDYSMKENVK